MFSDYGKISGQGTFCKTTSGSTFDQSVFLSYQQVGLRLATHWSDCVVTHCFKLQINADHHLVQCRGKKNKTMDVEDYHAVDDPKTRRSKSSGGQSFVQLVIGGVMLGFGLTYQEECNNGATDYLLLGGAIIIAANILPFITAIVFELGDCDVHRSESCVVRILLIIQSWLPIVSFGVTIWVKSFVKMNISRSFIALVFLFLSSGINRGLLSVQQLDLRSGRVRECFLLRQASV